MLFNLLIASIITLLYNNVYSSFFLFFNSLFIIPIVKEYTKVRLVLIYPARIPITCVKEIMLIPTLVADKTINALSV